MRQVVNRGARVGAALAAALGLALGSVLAAGAAPSATRGSFCGVSKGVAKNLVNIANQLKTLPSSTELKAEYGAISSAEPALKSSAPGSLKPHVLQVLGFVDNIAADLKQANWSITGLLPHEAALQAQENKVGPSIAALKAYYKNTCKFNV